MEIDRERREGREGGKREGEKERGRKREREKERGERDIMLLCNDGTMKKKYNCVQKVFKCSFSWETTR